MTGAFSETEHPRSQAGKFAPKPQPEAASRLTILEDRPAAACRTAADAVEAVRSGFEEVTVDTSHADPVDLGVVPPGTTVRAVGGSVVTVLSGAVSAHDRSRVTVTGTGTVTVDGDAHAEVHGDSNVTASGRATVEADGRAKVTAVDASTVRAGGETKVLAGGEAKVALAGRAEADLTDRALCVAASEGNVITLNGPHARVADRCAGGAVIVSRNVEGAR